MEIFNLSALAEDRRIVREREARVERLRRRRPRTEEPVPRGTAKPRCTSTIEHSARPA